MGESEAKNHPLSRVGFEKLLRAYYGDKKVVHIPNGDNDHIDMRIRPLKDKVVLLNDPALADAIICEIPRATLEKHEKSAGKGAYTQVLDAKDASDSSSYYDGMRQVLSAQGYRVVRLPSYLTHRIGFVMKEHNYANGFVEDYGQGGKRVLKATLPSYPLPELNEAVRKVYEGEGYQVDFVPGLEGRLNQGAALRCSIKVLERSYGSAY